VDVVYLDDFLARNRWSLEAVIEQNRGPLLRRGEAANGPLLEDIPEFWTAAKRTAGNIAAKTTAATLYAQKRGPNAEERAVLGGYSGGGGLYIQAVAGRFQPGFSAKEERGLIQERVRYRNEVTRPPPSGDRPLSCAELVRPRLRRRPSRPRPSPGSPPRAPESRPRASRYRP